MPRATFLPLIATASLMAEPEARIDFLKQVQPILAERCHSCHGRTAQQAGLRLDVRQAALRGGDYGPVIVPGKASESKLYRRLLAGGDGGLQMPPTGALPAEEIATLKAWIDQGADFVLDITADPAPKPVDPRVSALIRAVRTSDVAAVKRALTADAALVNGADAAGSTPLHHAAGFGSLETMRLLVDKGAKVDARNSRKSTPLLWAIRDEAKVRWLLDRGADIHARQAEGRTPLYQAASLGNGRAIVALLLAKGADPSVRTANGQTALMAAAARANVEVLELLLARKPDVNARAGNGGTALLAAAGAGNAAAVKLLLEAGADPNLMTKKKDSPLGEAATAGAEESVRLLLAAGAKVDVPDDRGYTPLLYAAASEAMPVGIVKRLLAAGANPEQKAEGETARSLAAKRGDTEVARLLGAPAAPVKVRFSEAPPALPVAVEKATTLLARQSANFIRIGGCNSCHGQDLTSAAAALARTRGLRAPAVVPQLSEAMRGASAERQMDLTAISPGSAAWELFDFGMNRVPRNEYTDAVIHYLKATQTAGGHWHATEGRRPPMSSGPFQAAALAIYAMKHYSNDSAAEIARAAAWLERAEPANTQDRAFQLMGLKWAGASAAAVERSAKALAARQREDGGWSQWPAMAPDAYATGQAAYALSLAGRPNAKAARFLLGTQATDGSWHVRTRSIWFQPYFESGFPYGHDQWISVAGTAWATLALAAGHEAPALSQR